MATEDILIRYRADVSQLEGDINKVIQSQEELTKATQQNTASQQKSVSAAEFAAKKRAQLLDQETKKLQEMKNAQKGAFDPAQVNKYSSEIEKSEKKIQSLGNTYQKAGQQASSANQDVLGGINKIGAAFGIAFTAEALINFAKQSVDAFLQAEEQAQKLRFAVTSIGGEGEQALARLTKQAEDLAAVTFFGDDDIIAAQAALSAFGLTADQIEEIIPKLADFAAVTGGTVTDAANTLGGALEGRAGEFKRFGIEVDAASTKAENLAKVSEGLAKQAGAAATALNTASGKAKDFQDQAGEATEAIGQGIVFYFSEFIKFGQEIYGPIFEGLTKIFNLLKNLIPQGLIDKIKEFTGQTSALGVVIRVVEFPLIVLTKVLQVLIESFIKVAAVVGGVVNVFKVGFKEIGDVVNNIGGGIADVLNGIADFDTNKISAGLNKVKGAFSKAGSDIASAFTQGYNKTLDLTKGTADQAEKVANAVTGASEKIFKSDELRKKSTKELNAELEKQSKIQSNAARQNVESINKELEARKKQGDAAKKAGDEAKKAAEEFKKLIDSIDGEIAKLQADLERRKIEVIPADTQKAQEDRIKALADLNEKAINDEIALKIKAVQEDDKLSTVQKNQAIAKYEELKKARLDLAQFNEQNELNIISAQQIDRIEAAVKAIDDLNIEQALVVSADKVQTANEAVAKSFEELGKAISKEDFAVAKQAAEARTKALNQALIEEKNLNQTRIENARDAELAKVKEGEAAEAERAAINLKYNNQIENNTKKVNDEIAKNNEDLNKQIEEQDAASAQRRADQVFQYLDATASVLSEVTNLYKVFSDQRIEEIEKVKEAELNAIDEQMAKVAEDLEFRRITDEQAKLQKESLEKAKVKAEEEAAKKINDIKRKQAVLDKANSLFQIAIDTAKNIVNQPGPFGSLIGLWIALGLAQAGVVAAQPIPYRKGSKDTGDKGHMARVGEEGEEFVWMPANSKVLPARQTKKYADVIDAMYDNKLDDYIYKNYITPQLIAQNSAKDNQRSKTFAENMANSIVYNQSGLTASDLEAQRKRGQYIRNVDELAVAIAKQLPKYDPYRN